MSYFPYSDDDGCLKGAKPKTNWPLISLKVALSILAITFSVFILLHSMGMRWSQVGIHFMGSLIYSTLIALPCMFIMRTIFIHYTGRFPRAIIVIQVVVLLCTAVVGCMAGTFALLLLGVLPPGSFWREFHSSVEFASVITLIIGMTTTSMETMRYKLQAAKLELQSKQVEQERAYKLLAESRLSSLESRIHPHFLFNTLNSIAALIPRDPQLAEDTVGKLASLLRFSLNANHSGLVALEQEMKIVRDYLEIERTRFGHRLNYEIAVPAALDRVNVPPLAVQSLVENVIKHVVSKRTEGATILIRGAVTDTAEKKHITIEVIDDGPGFSLESITPEHGLGNLIARLELLFGDDGQLEVTRENNKTAVRLTFPA